MATITQAPTARITADQFLAMDLGEGLHELVKGEIVEMPPPEYWHGFICSNVAALLHGFGRATGLGHAASNDSVVRISEDTVRGADVSYYSEARWPRSKVGKERPPVPPDLVAEVLSPRDRPNEVFGKVADYLRAGVAVVWVLDPEGRTLTIYRGDAPTPTVLGESDPLPELAVLPGFRATVAEFFA